MRHLDYTSFKKEAKTYVINNSERFLNLGNKNKARPRDLPELVPYEPPKIATVAQIAAKNKTNKSATTNVKRLGKKAKIDKPVAQISRIHKASPITKVKQLCRQDGVLPGQ
jgi:hypothetical protein